MLVTNGSAPGSTPGKQPIPNWLGMLHWLELIKNGMPDCARKMAFTSQPEKILSPTNPEPPMNWCPLPMGMSYSVVKDSVWGTSCASRDLLRLRWYGEMSPGELKTLANCWSAPLLRNLLQVYEPRNMSPRDMRFSAFTCNELYVE